MKAKKYFSLILTLVFIFGSIIPGAFAQSTIASQASLFAKAGSGDYYTLYTDGIAKEDAYIGGFKSVQLDPKEENIYFYDTVLKVIGKINIASGKVYKVIGKPKSSEDLDYTIPVKFNDAGLGKLTDFTFDKYGNIYILIHNRLTDDNGTPGATLDPRILKANLKDGTLTEVFNFDKSIVPLSNYSGTYGSIISWISYDNDRYIYIAGKLTVSHPTYGISQWDRPTASGLIIYKFDTISKIAEPFAASPSLQAVGITSKFTLNTNDSNYYTIKAFAFDYDSNPYISISDYTGSSWRTDISRLIPDTANTGSFKLDPFIGDGTGTLSDIGDGGQAKSAYAAISGAKCICGDKSGDLLLADYATNRVRKVFKNSGYIATAVGGGTETLTYGQFKAPRSISLQYPNSILVDKSNNLYIAENNRILTVTNLIIHDDKPQQQIKVANLAITKIAGVAVNNPKGDVSLPDLKLDYTYAGDQSVEIKGFNIPEGTNIKLLSTGTDGSTVTLPSNGKLSGGLTSIPVKIEAGTTKILKAETDPFIPFPGVYLPGTEPKIDPGQLLPEQQILTANRDAVNLPARNNISGNFINVSNRLNFFNLYNWKSVNGGITVTPYAGADPDNVAMDATALSFSNINDTLVLNTPNIGSNFTFSIWLKSDSGNISVPIGIGPNCPSTKQPQQIYTGSEGCGYPTYFANGQTSNIPLLSYSTVTVTPTWQKFSIQGASNLDNYAKTLFIGGLTQTNNKKIYIWGARLEKS